MTTVWTDPMKKIVLQILQDLVANTMSGCVPREINVFQNHFIVMDRMIVRIQVTRLVAVSLNFKYKINPFWTGPT